MSPFVSLLLIGTVLSSPSAIVRGLHSAQLRVLYSFDGASGAGYEPHAGVAVGKSGSLFGTTPYGGNSSGPYCKRVSCGTVYELTPSGGQYIERTLYNFKGGPDGASPAASLVARADGSLFGTTVGGGCDPQRASDGTAFQLTPSGDGYRERVISTFPACPYNPLERDPFGLLVGALLPSDDGTFFAMTCEGFGDTAGAVFSLTPSGNRYVTNGIFSFPPFPSLGQVPPPNAPGGSCPESALIRGAHGALFGTTVTGGQDAAGVVFKLTKTPGGYHEDVLYNFTGFSDGRYPYGTLVEDSRGVLYGTAYEGGNMERNFPYGRGTVYSLTPTANGYVEHTVYAFVKGDAAGPLSGLYADAGGAMYGTTVYGANPPGSDGTVYKLTPQGDHFTYNKIYVFKEGSTEPAVPLAGLVGGPHGELYGTSLYGGAYRLGTVYELLP